MQEQSQIRTNMYDNLWMLKEVCGSKWASCLQECEGSGVFSERCEPDDSTGVRHTVT